MHDSACVSHDHALARAATCDKRVDGFLRAQADQRIGQLLFLCSADLTNHHDFARLGILYEVR